MQGKDLGGPVLDTHTFKPTDWLADAQTQNQQEEVKCNLGRKSTNAQTCEGKYIQTN